MVRGRSLVCARASPGSFSPYYVRRYAHFSIYLCRNENIINICKDCYGNFMMQKLLTTCRRKERNFIIKTIFDNLDKLKDETYGRPILREATTREKAQGK
ncbi:mRNA-binding protein PUF2 (PUF2) [Plasmodium ovale curtisi]|uniref:mRNA-binding protein PUF2 (PUF2) n=1 Tax=Plasmodium ovale curtisi TaxID=864141 RepID=A0A1A8VQN8_PLAOA|nr:mRNA-binding protein PUF2 (PUF2) [Plasmodium ovale curtisi]